MAIHTNITENTKTAVNFKNKQPFLKPEKYRETIFLSPLDTYFIINCELGNKLTIVIPSLRMIKLSKKITVEINGSFNDGDIVIKALSCDKFDGEEYGVTYALNDVSAEFTITDENTWLGTNVTKQ
jgi:hypothetical protein